MAETLYVSNSSCDMVLRPRHQTLPHIIMASAAAALPAITKSDSRRVVILFIVCRHYILPHLWLGTHCHLLC